jgi:hypothetical protein
MSIVVDPDYARDAGTLWGEYLGTLREGDLHVVLFRQRDRVEAYVSADEQTPEEAVEPYLPEIKDFVAHQEPPLPLRLIMTGSRPW